MKKKILLVSLCSAMLLSGCSGMNEYLDNKIKTQSGIYEDENYQSFQKYTNQGKLDDEGYYSEEAFDSDKAQDTIQPGKAKISFAENQHLIVKYYSDAEMTQEISQDEDQFPVGSSIFTNVALDNTIPSNTYDFAGFRLSEVDENGEHTQLETLVPDTNGLLFQITSEYEGKDLIIAPYGDYSTRVVSLKSTYLDQDEKEHDLVGTWNVNDKPIQGNSAEINPISSYIISYDFDGKQYFYLSSEPECFYSNNEDGVVIFNKRESTDKTQDYEVKLHEYLSVKITSNQLRYVTIDNGEEREVKAGTELDIPMLKYGDTFVIVTDSTWDTLENCEELVCLSTETLRQSGQTSYRYTMTVPEKGAEFHFDPSEYDFEHGTLTFFCMGDEVTSPMELASGRKISYEQKSSDDGYWLPDGEHIITVTTPDQTKKEIEGIRFIEKIKVNVSLSQPKYGGAIEYYANGVKINNSQYSGDSGTEITMKFRPWEGWINKFNDGEKYPVSGEPSQTIDINGYSVDSAFEEDTNHKPELTVVLGKSLGENTKFTFEASGLDPQDYQYVPEWYRNDFTIISKHKIGTEQGISLSIGNSAIQTGTAIKIQIEKTGEDKSKAKTEKITESYCRLVDSLTALQEPIEIYDATNLGSSKVWYNSIKIVIKLVDVNQYTQPTALPNSEVEVRKTSTGDILKTGDILEGSEKVTMTIKPTSGYYIAGKSVKENMYQNTVEYEKLLSDASAIINNHPIEKFVTVVLDASDSYGICKYTVDGKEVSGTVDLKIGDKVKLEYNISDPSYVIDGASGFLRTPLGKNEKEKTERITIERTHDGQTLTRDSFGIKVRKEG